VIRPPEASPDRPLIIEQVNNACPYPLCGGNATGHWLGQHTSKTAIAIPNLLDARKGAE